VITLNNLKELPSPYVEITCCPAKL